MSNMTPETAAHYDEIMPVITQLAELLNPNSAEDVATDVASFQETLNEYLADDEDMLVDSIENDELGYLMADLIVGAGMGYSFNIDWKDSESAIDFLQDALEYADLDLQLDFGTPNPEEDLMPNQIFSYANQQLQNAGYYLLGLNSGSDSYCEILIPREIFTPFMQIMEQFDIDVDMNDQEIDE